MTTATGRRRLCSTFSDPWRSSVEADWAVEIGADLPSIVVPWEGFRNLRVEPGAASHLPEVAAYPALIHILQHMNSAASPLLTSKCDVWPLGPEEIDPFEFEASHTSCTAGLASYIDVITLQPACFSSFQWHEKWAAHLVAELRSRAIRQARVDLVLRAASYEGADGFGMTLYAAACGSDSQSVIPIWQTVLEAASDATIRTGSTGE